jgi:hypothetical protein
MLAPKKLEHCETCAHAEINPRTGLFNAGCLECTTRHIAHLPVFAECQHAGRLTEPYMASLKRVFGDDWKAGHESVKAWAKRIKEGVCA